LLPLEGETTLVDEKDIDLSGAIAQMELSKLENTTYTFVLANSSGDSLKFGYNHNEKQFFIDRKQSGQVDFSKTFGAKPSLAPRFTSKETLEIKFILDKASIELFYDEGATVMTEIFFSNAPFQTLSLITSAEQSRVEVFSIKELKKVN
jgi:levanase/fructan beta-fructosidase